MNEKEALEAFVDYSPKDIHELILYYQGCVQSELLPEELESFFISWVNHTPPKSLSLSIIKNGHNKLYSLNLNTNYENMEIIKKYIKLGVIKRFIKVEDYEDYED